MTASIAFLALFAAAAPCLGQVSRDQTSAGALAEYLRSRGFSASDLLALDRGEVVTRILGAEIVAANNTAEVAVEGAVRVDVPSRVFREAVSDVRGFRNQGVVRSGIIGANPRASDFEGLSLPARDASEMRACRPGRCALKLSREDIEGFRSRVDGNRPDYDRQVDLLAREKLLTAMSAYVREGAGAFRDLDDKPTAVSLKEQLDGLLQNTPELLAYYPEIHQYVRDYPRHPLPGSRSVFYWSLIDFGLKPTLRLTHVVDYVPRDTRDVVVLWTQLYASHYFNGGLGVTVHRTEGVASYVVHLDRLRADDLGGLFGSLKRSRMARAMRSSLQTFLLATSQDLKARAKRDAASTP